MAPSCALKRAVTYLLQSSGFAPKQETIARVGTYNEVEERINP